MNLKIIISKNPFASSSAGGNRWLTLIEGLADLNVAIELLITEGFGSIAEKNKFGIEGLYNNISYQYVNQVVLGSYWKTRYYLYLGKYYQQNGTIKKVQRIINKDKSIIWTDSSFLGFMIAYKIKQKYPNKYLFLEMSEFLDIHKTNKGNFLQRWQGDRRKTFFEKKAFRSYNGLALMTNKLFSYYSEFDEPRPILLHLPMTVDLKRFEPHFECLAGFKQPYIAFVGVMNDAKDGVNILIEAFAKISLQYPEHKLYLVGAWNYDTPSHQKMIKESGLQNRVFWMGEYKRDDIPSILKNASLLVLPRPDSKQAQGGFPTKLGEYLATGNPVCATTVGEIPDYLVDGESVYFAEPGSVDSFAKAMQRALSNPSDAKRIGLNGMKVAKKYFNKDLQAKKLHEFFKKKYG